MHLLRDIDIGDPARGLPKLACVGLAVGVWVVRRNASLAIVASTAAFTALVNLAPGLSS